MQKLQRKNYELFSESSQPYCKEHFRASEKVRFRQSTCTPHMMKNLMTTYHIAIGEKAIELDKHLVYLALVSKGQGIRVIVFVEELQTRRSRPVQLQSRYLAS